MSSDVEKFQVLASIQSFHILMSRPFCHFCHSIDYQIEHTNSPTTVISFNPNATIPTPEIDIDWNCHRYPALIDCLPHRSKDFEFQSLGHKPSTTESIVPKHGRPITLAVEEKFPSTTFRSTMRKELSQPAAKLQGISSFLLPTTCRHAICLILQPTVRFSIHAHWLNFNPSQLWRWSKMLGTNVIYSRHSSSPVRIAMDPIYSSVQLISYYKVFFY